MTHRGAPGLHRETASLIGGSRGVKSTEKIWEKHREDLACRSPERERGREGGWHWPGRAMTRRGAPGLYRGTSRIRNSAPLGPYKRTKPKALRWSQGGRLSFMSEVPLYQRTASLVESSNPSVSRQVERLGVIGSDHRVTSLIGNSNLP